MSVVAVVFDRCLSTTVLNVFGAGAVEELQLNPNLKSANLRATISASGSASNPVEVTVDLVWDGAGRKDRTSEQVRTRLGVYTYISNATGTIRDAAAAGSVVVGGLDVTPLPSSQGFIEKDSTRSLTIYR